MFSLNLRLRKGQQVEFTPSLRVDYKMRGEIITNPYNSTLAWIKPFKIDKKNIKTSYTFCTLCVHKKMITKVFN